jgi:FixJ family two-component response regulator
MIAHTLFPKQNAVISKLVEGNGLLERNLAREMQIRERTVGESTSPKMENP